MRGGGNSEPLILNDSKSRNSVLRKKFFAFTLAEVLITLGIIGVVAALTLPTLISKHQKKVYSAQLKKTINTIENGFRKIMADEGVDYIYLTSIFEPFGTTYKINSEKFKQYFNLEYMPEDSLFNSVTNSWAEEVHGMYFDDGSCVGFKSTDQTYDIIFLDINCDRKPNIPGYDRFSMQYEAPKNSLFFQNNGVSGIEAEEFKKLFKTFISGNTGDLNTYSAWTMVGTFSLLYLINNNYDIDY